MRLLKGQNGFRHLKLQNRKRDLRPKFYLRNVRFKTRILNLRGLRFKVIFIIYYVNVKYEEMFDLIQIFKYGRQLILIFFSNFKTNVYLLGTIKQTNRNKSNENCLFIPMITKQRKFFKYKLLCECRKFRFCFKLIIMKYMYFSKPSMFNVLIRNCDNFLNNYYTNFNEHGFILWVW